MRRSYADDISGDEIMNSGADIENDRVKDLLAGAFIAAAGEASPGPQQCDPRSSQPGCPSSNDVYRRGARCAGALDSLDQRNRYQFEPSDTPLRAEGGVSDWHSGVGKALRKRAPRDNVRKGSPIGQA